MAHHGPIDLAFVQNIIDVALPEDQELEYKRELPKKLTPEQAKHTKQDPFDEFAKDVSAMANATGGVLLYGLAEDDKTKVPTLYPITDEPYDHAATRLTSLLNNLIEPRLMGVTFHKIEFPQGYVLGIKVPGSFAGPHWHGKPERRRFNVRRLGIVSDYTYQELRAAFDRNASASVAARQWIDDRVAAIKMGRTWRPLIKGPTVIVHLLPLAAYFQEQAPIDLKRAKEVAPELPRPWGGGYSDQINFDGYAIFQNPGRYGPPELVGYNQIFRNGSMELVLHVLAYRDPNEEVKNLVPDRIAKAIREGITKGPQVLQKLGKEGPLLIGVALIGVSAVQLPDMRSFQWQSTDRDDLAVPVAYVENPTSSEGLAHLVKGILDMLWQGFGWPNAPYDDMGNHVPFQN
jgi:hypothetical protein